MNTSDKRSAVGVILRSLLNSVEDLDDQSRSAVLIEVAALMLETAAYDMAGKIGASEVSKLIICSAELERLADKFREDEMQKSVDNVVSIRG